MAIKIDGAERIIQRIYAFDKEVWKVLQKEIREASDEIRKEAQSSTPSVGLGNWGPWSVATGRSGSAGSVTFSRGSRDISFFGSQVQRSIKSQARSRAGRAGADRSIAGRVVINDAAGAIFALAGSKNRSGHRFNDNLNTKHGAGPWPRLIGPAWTSNVDRVRDLIDAAIDKAAREVTRG